MLQRRTVPETQRPPQTVLSCLTAIRVTAFLACATLLLTGCGAEQYEKRLDNTKKLFAHMELLDSNLHRDWVDGDVGVQLRLPLQFASIAAPSGGDGGSLGGAKGGGAAPAAAAHDPRQPSYMNIELPGMRGAFLARLKVIGANRASSDEEGFIYVLTNHHLANAGDRIQAFHSDVISLLSQTLRVSVKPDETRQATFPPGVGTFAQPVSYKQVTLSPSEPVFGVERTFSLYMHEQGSIQTIVLFVLPKDVDGIERLTDRVPLCLETLRVKGDKPVVPARPTGSAPAKANAGF